MIHDSRIVQVLDNLLANAVSFAPPNSTITITLGTDAQASNAILTFADEGPGIPPGRLESVFNRFYTERPSAEAFGQHSGLGLSIARQIVRGHGGELTASNISDNKTGACFTMTLPLMVTQDS
jgi:two-component system sensor histidine kinase ChvG